MINTRRCYVKISQGFVNIGAISRDFSLRFLDYSQNRMEAKIVIRIERVIPLFI